MASQQLSMFGHMLFRNVAETLLWWLVGRTTVAKWHGAKKYRSMFSTAHKGRYQSSSRSARMNNKTVNMCSLRQLTGLMPTTSILIMTVPACFPDGWRVWFGTAICWGFDASDPRVSSLKEARLSTDIIFTNTCCDAKKNESVKVYELPTGFTLEATVSSSDSEITQWLLLQVSAFQPLSIIVSSA